jgi:ABC-type multidrug transport system ATPase subunit
MKSNLKNIYLNLACLIFNRYSLLGASGCGKTTILSCVVGLKELDCGEITVLGAKPGSNGSGVPGKRVGYMPQVKSHISY